MRVRYHCTFINLLMPFSLIATASAGLSLLLSLWLLVGTWGNHGAQRRLQGLQDEIQSRQLAIQSQQQQLQAQQQQIDSGAQLANQVGPAMLRDLAELSVVNKNEKISELLKKYGLEVKANPEAKTEASKKSE
jgi:multidrug efflux pump subunit AcrA (membrane-fusion protein)